MLIFETIAEYKKWRNSLKQLETLGFVPTMGCLHPGHLALINESTLNNTKTVVSIYVNPLQFGKNEDFDAYPRTINEDIKALEKNGVDILFLPSDEEMYSKKSTLTLHVDSAFNQKLCGPFRPDHFSGVATIVLKLLNIIEPNYIYMGQKDYQQSILIDHLITDFNIPAEILCFPTIRENDGLAMSSRNRYLSRKGRQLAPALFKSLTELVSDIRLTRAISPISLFKELEIKLHKISKNFNIQYIESYTKQLERVAIPEMNNMVLAAAVFLDEVRLIDNIFY